MVIDPNSGMTLLAMAKALWKTSLTNSKENVAGSPDSEVQVRVTLPPEVGFSGIWS